MAKNGVLGLPQTIKAFFHLDTLFTFLLCLQHLLEYTFMESIFAKCPLKKVCQKGVAKTAKSVPKKWKNAIII